MNTLETVVVGLVVSWLLVLTLIVILIVRQIGLITLRFEFVSGTEIPLSDGPDIGTAIPQGVLEKLSGFGQGLSYLLLLSSTCTQCHELGPQLRELSPAGQVFTLVPGRAETATELVVKLPDWVRVIVDPMASEIANELDFKLTPAALEVEEGVVTGKTHLKAAADLQRFMDARSESDAAEFARRIKEASTHAS